MGAPAYGSCLKMAPASPACARFPLGAADRPTMPIPGRGAGSFALAARKFEMSWAAAFGRKRGRGGKEARAEAQLSRGDSQEPRSVGPQGRVEVLSKLTGSLRVSR